MALCTRVRSVYRLYRQFLSRWISYEEPAVGSEVVLLVELSGMFEDFAGNVWAVATQH